MEQESKQQSNVIYLKIRNNKAEFCWHCNGDGYLIKGEKGRPAYVYRCVCPSAARYPNYPLFSEFDIKKAE